MKNRNFFKINSGLLIFFSLGDSKENIISFHLVFTKVEKLPHTKYPVEAPLSFLLVSSHEIL